MTSPRVVFCAKAPWLLGILGGALVAIAMTMAVRAEMPTTVRLGYNFDESEWEALPFEAKRAIILDDPNKALDTLALPELRRGELSEQLFRTEFMQFHAEYILAATKICHPDLAQDLAALSAVLPAFWDRVNAYLKNRFPEVDAAMIDRAMRTARAKAMAGAPQWPREACSGGERQKEFAREDLGRIRAALTVENLDAVMNEPILQPVPEQAAPR